MESNKIVRIENINYKIKEGEKTRNILKDVNYSFLNNSITVISGPSGSGKTTLLYAIAGLLDDVDGEIYIDNFQINKLTKKKKDEFRLNNISMVFQNLNLFSFMNVEDNILVPFYIKDKKIDEDVHRKISEYLQLMNLGQIQNKSIQSLSGGEQQRVAIIRAIIDNPKVILCDEPTASLDKNNVVIFMETLLKIKKSTESTIIIVTHDERVTKYGENKISMVDGSIE
ncbi:putative ABC transport system ATP-binding protein [Lachnotalea glycerini]|uniref:Putative ABC transport system ATP-binding protein n=1 Tax=Lachnotalea glycerini TaxID=1763509 RepID=A0A318EUM1_9FIRM|nr:ABC transporter ATP-binding protein [Lachnotalea glycerini]PXV93252.1 putative ABC transport system ATP-binding protein [Lachnotalea glycerini]